MVKIKYKEKKPLERVMCGETFLYNGILGMRVSTWCDECASYNSCVIELATGMDMELNDDIEVMKVDIEINILY